MLLSSIAALVNAAVSGTRPLISLRAHELGASPVMIGLVVSVFALLPLFAAIPVGIQVDRRGARPFLLLGAIGTVISMSIVAISPTYNGLILAQIGAGFSHLSTVVACQTVISRLGTPADRENNVGLFSTFMSAGLLIGPIVGGYLADRVGNSAAFLSAALFGLISLIMVMTMRASADGAAQRRERNAGGRVPILPLLKNPAVVVSVVSGFAQIFAWGTWEAFFPIWMQGNGHSTTVTGMVLSFQAFISLVIRTGLKFLSTLVGGRFRLLLIGMAMGGVAVGLLPLTAGLLQIGAIAALSGASNGLVFPLGIIAVAVGTTDRERGLGMGIRLTGNRLAQLSNPLLFGVIASAGGLSTAFFAGGAILLLVTAGLLPFVRSLPDVDRGSASPDLTPPA